MKVFGIFTVIVLTALINGSSALWCECKEREWLDSQNVGTSLTCCRRVMGSDLMGGFPLFGLTPKDWCDTSRDKVAQYKKCCDNILNNYGYCK